MLAHSVGSCMNGRTGRAGSAKPQTREHRPRHFRAHERKRILLLKHSYIFEGWRLDSLRDSRSGVPSKQRGCHTWLRAARQAMEQRGDSELPPGVSSTVPAARTLDENSDNFIVRYADRQSDNYEDMAASADIDPNARDRAMKAVMFSDRRRLRQTRCARRKCGLANRHKSG